MPGTRGSVENQQDVPVRTFPARDIRGGSLEEGSCNQVLKGKKGQPKKTKAVLWGPHRACTGPAR